MTLREELDVIFLAHRVYFQLGAKLRAIRHDFDIDALIASCAMIQAATINLMPPAERDAAIMKVDDQEIMDVLRAILAAANPQPEATEEECP